MAKTTTELIPAADLVTEPFDPATHLPMLAKLVPDPAAEKPRRYLADAAELQKIKDATDYKLALDVAGFLAGCEKDVKEHFEPFVDGANKLHKSLTTRRGAMLAKLSDERARLNRLAVAWKLEEDRKRRLEEERIARELEETRRAEQAQRDKEAEEAAAKLEAEGKIEQAAAVIEERTQEAAVEASRPTIAVMLPRNDTSTSGTGSSERTTYKATLKNLRELVEAAAKNWEAYGQYLAGNDAAAGAAARASKGTIKIPGYEITAEVGLSNRAQR